MCLPCDLGQENSVACKDEPEASEVQRLSDLLPAGS